MSQTHGHDQAPGTGGDQDAVDYGKVIGVGVASLLIFAVSIWWSSIILHSARADVVAKTGVPKEVPSREMPAEIGIVDQVPFNADHRLVGWRAERKAYLEGYGWVDRSKGVVHIPIDLALQQVAGGASPAGAPK
ncbi:MAG TPA: hypothetical protein VHJ20_09090 [Polyangia bacterium]|nr:hypothetical protein [Polyangia bacterium]